MKTADPAPPALDLSVQYAAAMPSPPTQQQVRALVSGALAAAGCKRGEITVRFVDEQESADLSGKYRNKPQPTNVLSFDYRHTTECDVLGDVLLCAPVICREARQQGKTPTACYAHMIVHGVLHLAGYCHDSAAAAAAMEKMERQILQQFNIEDPY